MAMALVADLRAAFRLLPSSTRPARCWPRASTSRQPPDSSFVPCSCSRSVSSRASLGPACCNLTATRTPTVPSDERSAPISVANFPIFRTGLAFSRSTAPDRIIELPFMSYQVLARKYRPQKFSDVIGQDHVTRTLKNAIEQQRIAHGYIFSGHRGIGKTTIARILAMALNCRSTDHPVPEPCGVCDSCREIREGSVGAMDVIEIDAASNRGIDEVRGLIATETAEPARD